MNERITARLLFCNNHAGIVHAVIAGLNTSVDIYEKRRARLRQIIDTRFGGQIVRLAEAIDVKAPSVSRWLSTTTSDPRNITEPSARTIEAKLGLPANDLDQGVIDEPTQQVMQMMQSMQLSTRYTVLQLVQVLRAAEPTPPNKGKNE